MAGIAGFAMLAAIFAATYGYQSWLRASVRPREVRTRLPPEEVKRLFAQKVAGMGWKVIDDDNPMVAQSSMLAGRRQEISMTITPDGDGLHLRIWVSRLWTKGIGRVPYKAHTIRMRMNAFERSVQGPSTARSTGVVAPAAVAVAPTALPAGVPSALTSEASVFDPVVAVPTLASHVALPVAAISPIQQAPVPEPSVWFPPVVDPVRVSWSVEPATPATSATPAMPATSATTATSVPWWQL